MSLRAIYADSTVNITELRRNPSSVIEEADNRPVAILNHNRPAAYLVPAEAFEAIIEALEDAELGEIVRQRRGGKTVKVSMDEL
jgi:antitoxin StbD